MTLSEPSLRRWYRDFNRRWFANRLGHEVDILYAPIEGCWGDTRPDDPECFVIRINPRYSLCTRSARLTLLHEMVHVELWPYAAHGPRFEARMQALAAAGAMRGLW